MLGSMLPLFGERDRITFVLREVGMTSHMMFWLSWIKF